MKTRSGLPPLRFVAVLATLVVLLLHACASPQDVPGAVRVHGVVRYVDLEGGCWVMEAGEDVRTKKFYELRGEQLPDVSFNDAEVTLWIVPKPDVASSCQVGVVADIIDVVDVRKPRK